MRFMHIPMHITYKRSELMLLQISNEDLSTSDIERLLMSRQLQVDVVRRLGNRVCQAQRSILQRASNPALVRCYRVHRYHAES